MKSAPEPSIADHEGEGVLSAFGDRWKNTKSLEAASED
jgi:hypothetical protein